MKQWIKKCWIQFQHLIFKWQHHHGVRPLVYFESFHGKQYSDNPRAIYEGLKQAYPEVEVVWGVKKGYEAPFDKYQVPYVYRFTKEWYQSVGRASVWVTNTRTKTWIEKHPKTCYIETWHGTPLKRLGLDIQSVNIGNETTEGYHQSVKEETALWDYLISPSRYATEIFSQAFNIPQEKILEVGYPRNDQLFLTNQREQARIKRKLGINENQSIILYAPTWRDNLLKENNTYGFTFPFDIDSVLNVLPKDAILLIRMHYLVKEAFDFSKYNGRVIDVSDYEEMGELLQISDLLITDYSSVFFDFSLLHRPMIFYMFDRKDYQEALRGTYFDVDTTLPAPIVETQEALLEQLFAYSQGKSILDEEKWQAFHKKFNQFEKGSATEQVINVIMEAINKNRG